MDKSRCSLTIREGVSKIFVKCLVNYWFPHYTWGCIEEGQAVPDIEYVPSLYVRVYRIILPPMCLSFSSLTIREGVSWVHIFIIHHLLFPHYTWGCITKLLPFSYCRKVPSLYVRVYHDNRASPFLCFCSLTIREGVSESSMRGALKVVFPHYTWGCIEWYARNGGRI